MKRAYVKQIPHLPALLDTIDKQKPLRLDCIYNIENMDIEIRVSVRCLLKFTIIQSTLVNSTMHNSILSLISTRWPGPGIFPYILLQFHNVYLDNG